MGSEIGQLPDLTARQELFTAGLKVRVLMDCRCIPARPDFLKPVLPGAQFSFRNGKIAILIMISLALDPKAGDRRIRVFAIFNVCELVACCEVVSESIAAQGLL
jgi:hypothetical protein